MHLGTHRLFIAARQGQEAGEAGCIAYYPIDARGTGGGVVTEPESDTEEEEAKCKVQRDSAQEETIGRQQQRVTAVPG